MLWVWVKQLLAWFTNFVGDGQMGESEPDKYGLCSTGRQMPAGYKSEVLPGNSIQARHCRHGIRPIGNKLQEWNDLKKRKKKADEIASPQ